MAALRLLLALLLAFSSTACGGPASSQSPDGTGASGGSEPAPGPRGASEGGAAADGDRADVPDPGAWAPLPELSDTEETPVEPRPEPTLTSLDAARRALREGFYDAVRAYLDDHRDPEERHAKRLLLARLDHVTGRYEASARHAKAAAGSGPLRTEAMTVRGEALLAQGELDEAEEALRAVSEEDDAHRARLRLGQLLLRRGQRSEARRWLYRLIDAYNDDRIGLDDGEGLAHVAVAASALGAHRDANEAFQQAARANPDRVETQLDWAQLFLDKYDPGHAYESVEHALARNPERPEAHALLARIHIDQNFDFEAAEGRLTKALEVNPNLVMAHVTRAGMSLREGDFAQTEAHLERALAVDPHDLEALSVRAAAELIAGDEAGFDRAEEAVLDRNPEFARMYTIISDYADWEHRYRDIVKLARKAVRIDPKDGLAYATLGLNQMRTGDEEEGLKALRESWRRDRFNVQVFNTLNLYDDVIPKQYEELSTGPFVFRMHTEEKPMLERYVPELLTGAYRDMVQRYRYEPQGPVRIEMYGDPEHFAVRTTGLPQLGVQGVCFGKVITAISPRGGPFNWGQITWHELAHVFHLQLSDNRVPRWFTEGLAEYETIEAGHGWRREMDHTLWLALDADRLPELALMNRAFTHAKSAEEMVTAYYASSQAVKYIVERFGMPKVVAMLRAWGRGKTTPAVVREVLGTDLATLDRDFRSHTRERLAARADDFTVDFERYRDLEALREAAEQAPEDPSARAALAVGLAVAGKAEQATKLARQVVARVPAQPVARFLLARLAFAHRAPKEARSHLERLLEGGVDGYEVRLLAGRAAAAERDAKAVDEHLKAAVRIDGDRPEAWMALAALAATREDAELRLRALEKLARIDEHGRDTMAALLPLLFERERWADLVRFGRRGVQVDPHRAETHRLYAEGLLHTGKAREALFELDSALLADPKKPGAVHLARARALVALGRRAEAKKAADTAVDADSSLAPRARDILEAR
ncbi:MAG: tetratricopeptide repeat protein [Myxococcota bacterium]